MRLIAILALLLVAVPCWAEKTPEQDKEKAKKVKVSKSTTDALKAYMQAKGVPYGWVASGKYDVDLADLLRQQFSASTDDPKTKREKVK